MKLNNTQLLLCVLISSFITTRSDNVGDDDLVVELANPRSKIQGHILQSQNNANFFAFQDIPYAAPPIGQNRFKPPQPVSPWDGILNTVYNQKVCPQISSYLKLNAEYVGEEDCLVLNVYSPVRPGTESSLPVFFWIHGGAFLQGAGNIYGLNPKFLIDYGIVIVTINYRLGALGFLTTNDNNIPGNLGYKDQQLALKWTQDNIHLFGGDPRKVTIGGESAGGMSVGSQMLSRQSTDMFRGVIESSGSGIGTVVYQNQYQKWAFEFGKALDDSFNSNQSGELVQLLQRASLEEIMAVQAKLGDYSGTDGFMTRCIWKPILEDPAVQGAILTGPLLDNLQYGNFNRVPLLIGFNSEESLTFLYGTSEEQMAWTAKNFDDNPGLVFSDLLNVPEEIKQYVGAEFKKLYTSRTFSEDRGAFIRYTSDEVFIRSTARQAEAVSAHVPVYLYQLSWGAIPGEAPGVPHTADLLYIWLDASPSQTFIPQLREPLLKLYTNFIKELNPTPVRDEVLQNFQWIPVQPGAVRYFNINETFEMLENPRNYYQMKQILDGVAQPPHNVF